MLQLSRFQVAYSGLRFGGLTVILGLSVDGTVIQYKVLVVRVSPYTCHKLKPGSPAMPLVTQSDPGSENNGIANGHTLLHHMQDPALARTLQHKFKGQHRNIKPEIFWSQLR
jgi:hypothetical protein